MKVAITAKEALSYLEENELSQKESIRLVGILNKHLGVFPLDEVIKPSIDGGILANGQKLTMEELVKFRQGISALRDNWAFQLLGDQIFYESIKNGIHYGDTPDKIIYSRTTIYFITKFREYISKFDIHQ